MPLARARFIRIGTGEGPRMLIKNLVNGVKSANWNIMATRENCLNKEQTER